MRSTSGRRAPTGCAGASSWSSGARISTPTRWRSTAAAGRVACARPTGTLSVLGARHARARQARVRHADGGCVLQWLGSPDGCRERAPIQPAVLSQRLDLAARQRHRRRRRLAVWISTRPRILNATLELSEAVDLHRLPELICGVHRRGREPTLYPVACAPQAWAAGAAFLMLAASLGMQIDAPRAGLVFTRADCPSRSSGSA